MSVAPLYTSPSERLRSWASICEDNTLAQAEQLSTMPFVYPHVALMPDAHLGKGATVGSVLPTERALIPAAVGVDIGCGMIAHRTTLTVHDLPADLATLRADIEDRVPVSPGVYNVEDYDDETATRIIDLEATARDAEFSPSAYARNWTHQLGSLGGGNHFIEVCADEADRVWLFLHSGSRGVGNRIAQHHIKVARALCERWWIALPDPDLAYLVEGTDEFWAYVRQLRWAQRFALLNRAEMMHRVEDALRAFAGDYDVTDRVNCHHNYTTQERHFGRQVWLSRKGAIDASAGTRGLIPGSMGDTSYVVTGLGNHLALNSAPHGAGRAMSRGVAKRTFDLDEMRERMAGIEWRSETDAFLDEHPGAYKAIDVVMSDASSMVTIDHTLRQLVNVKGS